LGGVTWSWPGKVEKPRKLTRPAGFLLSTLVHLDPRLADDDNHVDSDSCDYARWGKRAKMPNGQGVRMFGTDCRAGTYRVASKSVSGSKYIRCDSRGIYPQLTRQITAEGRQVHATLFLTRPPHRRRMRDLTPEFEVAAVQ
jgi:hypothetical protein